MRLWEEEGPMQVRVVEVREEAMVRVHQQLEGQERPPWEWVLPAPKDCVGTGLLRSPWFVVA
jgi:hypothetical protein